MTMRVYIAGPMSGIDKFNFPAFFAVDLALREAGYATINPADNDGMDLRTATENAGKLGGWADYMRRDLPRLCQADAVCVLPGWNKSRGASLEVFVAQELGMPVYRWNDGTAELELIA